MELVKKIFGYQCRIACLSAMTDYYVRNAPAKKWLSFRKGQTSTLMHMSDYLSADYVVIPGMVGTKEYLNSPARRMVDTLVKKGCKAIFLGLGGIDYDKDEIEAISAYFKQIKPAFITTRDNDVYGYYKDIVPCIRGLDCAFWVIDAFDPKGFVNKSYNVVTFNRMTEPVEFKDMHNVIRPWHMQYAFRKEMGDPSVMISDTPYDYLTLYANADKVYTDLVHATITSLMYGTPVKFYKNGTRWRAFEALDDLKSEDGWLSVDKTSLESQKEKIIREIKAIVM